MEVIVDKTRFEAAARGAAMETIAAVSAALESKGRSILCVTLDGVALEPSRMAAALGEKPVSAIATIEITSEETSKLISDSLAELESVLPELPKVCRDLAAMFQSAEPQSGYAPFQQLADIWAHVKNRQALIARAMGVDLEALTLDGKSVGVLHTELNGFLSESIDAMQAGDLILLGDLLEYELAPRAEKEAKITTLLREQSRG